MENNNPTNLETNIEKSKISDDSEGLGLRIKEKIYQVINESRDRASTTAVLGSIAGISGMGSSVLYYIDKPILGTVSAVISGISIISLARNLYVQGKEAGSLKKLIELYKTTESLKDLGKSLENIAYKQDKPAIQ